MVKVYVAPEYFDADRVISARSNIDELAQAAEDVVIDMAAVKHLDCSGVGALAFVMKRLLRGGHRLRIIRIEGQPARLLQELQAIDTPNDNRGLTDSALVFDPSAAPAWRDDSVAVLTNFGGDATLK
jgi:anti-anti-sigma factor